MHTGAVNDDWLLTRAEVAGDAGHTRLRSVAISTASSGAESLHANFDAMRRNFNKATRRHSASIRFVVYAAMQRHAAEFDEGWGVACYVPEAKDGKAAAEGETLEFVFGPEAPGGALRARMAATCRKTEAGVELVRMCAFGKEGVSRREIDANVGCEN